MTFLIYSLIILALVAGVSVLFMDVFSSIIAAGFVSLMVSILFLILKAPDVAMAEVSIGAALTIGILLFAKAKSDKVMKKL